MDIETQVDAGLENLQNIIEHRVTSGLGYERIPHYDDTDVGLIRHLATMNLRCLSSYSSQILDNLRYKLVNCK